MADTVALMTSADHQRYTLSAWLAYHMTWLFTPTLC